MQFHERDCSLRRCINVIGCGRAYSECIVWGACEANRLNTSGSNDGLCCSCVSGIGLVGKDRLLGESDQWRKSAESVTGTHRADILADGRHFRGGAWLTARDRPETDSEFGG
jgi:hypothetical protein